MHIRCIYCRNAVLHFDMTRLLIIHRLIPRHFYPKNFQLSICQSNAAQHQAVTTEAFYSIDAHASHHLLDLMAPTTKKINEPSGGDIRVDSLRYPRVGG